MHKTDTERQRGTDKREMQMETEAHGEKSGSLNSKKHNSLLLLISWGLPVKPHSLDFC